LRRFRTGTEVPPEVELGPSLLYQDAAAPPPHYRLDLDAAGAGGRWLYPERLSPAGVRHLLSKTACQGQRSAHDRLGHIAAADSSLSATDQGPVRSRSRMRDGGDT